jgi:hydrogenase maturation protein HypF
MERRAIVVRGIIQSVGFRPFVYNLAARFDLHGFVKNQTGSVLIEIEGESAALDSFLTELCDKPPPLAQIEQLSWESRQPQGEQQFRIEPSDLNSASSIFVSPDVATCADCRAELLNPADRRHGYPFLNCTNCGPRLTIITGAPYDRQRTTMASFVMCPACRAEYENPADRRFHAEPTCCAVCGPRLRLLDGTGKLIDVGDPLACFAAAVRAGKIGAMKGLGGYHLVCEAKQRLAVAELRRRKHRDEKPFAIMVPDIAGAEALCEVAPAERDLLQSPACPIVLLRKRPANGVAADVAPHNPWLGVMLPYTALHHLLMRAVQGAPLVMTSGNRSDEPIAYQDDTVEESLKDIADQFLVHDRPIHVRCDDSVTRIVAGEQLPVRRSRGYAPRPVVLPLPCPCPILAVGGQLKATFALGRDRQAFLSHHLGDLNYYAAYDAFVKDVDLYEELFAIRPECLVHDLHPDYATTSYAQLRAAREGIQLLTTQHHHAHMASCMAEHGLNEPVIGVTFDGAGYGTDGAIWGGEFLVGAYRQFRRAAHLRYVGMPGGDQAIRQPWRMAVSYLADAQVHNERLTARLLRSELQIIDRMLERRIQTPPTSSVGRLFDAVAALAGVRDRVSYEGQAAVELESLASPVAPAGTYPFAIERVRVEAAVEPLFLVDTRPLTKAISAEAIKQVDAAIISRRFHSTMVDIIAQVCSRIREATNIGAVVLSGGVFLNALLVQETLAQLQKDGFCVYRHRLVPPNDGGLSLGQLAIAAALLTAKQQGEIIDVPRHSRTGHCHLP